ncbi:MAG: sugar-binding domain-containing protein [Bacteroidota bacterium]
MFILLFGLNSLLICCSDVPEKEKLSLKGEWKIRLDSSDIGIKKQWYRQDFRGTAQLPGSLQEQGYGNDIDSSTSWTGTVKGNFHQDPKYKEYRQEDDYKVPFWLNPEKHYKGAAWYQKKVNIPENWTEKQVKLVLERPHWETTVFVNGEKTGVRNSLSAPHEYDLTGYLTPGENNLTIRVDNRLVINVGKNSHSVTDHTQSNWNGITGDIFLKAEPQVHIEDMQIYPDVQNDMATVEVRLNNETGKRYEGQMTFQAQTEQAEFGHKLEEVHRDIRVDSSRTVRVDYFMGDDPLLWSEFDPNLYSMQVRLQNTDNEQMDADSVIFGMREFTTKETRFVINHRPTYLRGTLECAIFPDTGYPPTDTASWGRIFRTIKKHGLNHMRFHSWCPPEAAFTAADKAGIYLQVEVASWANQGAELGSGLPIDQWIYEESNRIVEEYGNHPSFCMMAYGNEPAGENQQKYLTEFVEYWKNKDSRRLYTSASGWPLIEASQFHVAPQPRIQGWGEELNSVINREPPHTTFNHEDFVSEYDKPVIGHEIGQWCVYPNFDEMKKYTGVLKPKNFEIFRDMLKDNHMLDKAEKFHMASGKLQALCYKADIEAALRTPGFAGFQLLDLHDFPGQGTALVGVLDPFWESKPYISPQKYSRFCGPTVPLAKLSKRIYRNSETFEATIELAHFGSSLLINIPMNWKIEDSTGKILQKGELQKKGIPYDNSQKIGDIRFDLKEIEKPQKLTLTATLSEFGSKENLLLYGKFIPF